MDIGIQKYKALLETAKLGSFTRAAALMNYSQSGISRMIADLEKEWGVVMLERSRGAVRLTSDGLELLPYLERLCLQYDQLQAKIGELNGLQSGRIRIGAFASVATHWLPNIIREFQKDYPKIDYEIVTGYADEIEAWILSGRVDCGFTLLPCGAGLEAIPMEEGRMLGIVPSGHPLAQGDRLSLEALCREPFLLLEKDAKYEISLLFETRGLHPRYHYTVADDYAIMSMVENGLGVSILSELILQRADYSIVALELDPPVTHSIAFAVRSVSSASLAVKKFMEYLCYR